jgi:ferredoxin
MSACSRCGSGIDTGQTGALPRIAEALAQGDVALALDRGLLDWNGCEDCARCSGLSLEQVALLSSTRASRMKALEARQRFRTREQRLQRRAEERARRRLAPVSALPPAAAAALARARTRAGKP